MTPSTRKSADLFRFIRVIRGCNELGRYQESHEAAGVPLTSSVLFAVKISDKSISSLTTQDLNKLRDFAQIILLVLGNYSVNPVCRCTEDEGKRVKRGGFQ